MLNLHQSLILEYALHATKHKSRVDRQRRTPEGAHEVFCTKMSRRFSLHISAQEKLCAVGLSQLTFRIILPLSGPERDGVQWYEYS